MRCVPIALIVLSLSVLPAGAAAMFVAVDRLEVRSSTGFFSQNVGELELGDEVTLVRESGRWSEVRMGSLAGWVPAASLSPRRVARAGTAVTPGEVALAGKGFGREVESEYGIAGDLDFSLVDAMEAPRIPWPVLLRFILDGRLSAGGQ